MYKETFKDLKIQFEANMEYNLVVMNENSNKIIEEPLKFCTKVVPDLQYERLDSYQNPE